MQLGHHAFGQFSDLAGTADVRFRKKTFRFRAVESRMHAGDVIERLRNSDPSRQHSDVGYEADIAHQLIALGPRVAAQHPQLSMIRSEADYGVERGGLACAVGADDSQDAALFNTQINAVQRNGGAEGLAEATCFYHCHGFSVPPLCLV
jgi:hypothetical protein